MSEGRSDFLARLRTVTPLKVITVGVILILIMFVLPGGVASLIRRATAPIVRNLNRPKRPKPEPQLLPESAER